MKQLLLWIILSSILLPAIPFFNEFDIQVESGYAQYVVLDDYETPDFRIKIVLGVYNDQVTYGVAMYSADARRHNLVIEINDKAYQIRANQRGDASAPAISYEEATTFFVFDEKGNARYTNDIEVMTKMEFLAAYRDTLLGQDTGYSLTPLQRIITLSGAAILTIVFAGVALIFGGIILYLFVTKKGMFDPEHKLRNVLNFKDYTEMMLKNNMDDLRNIETDESIEEIPSNQSINPNAQLREYDEEIEATFDVKAYLAGKGYNTDYANATDEEKNDIMLELMKMRDFNDISKEIYQKEVIELWRK